MATLVRGQSVTTEVPTITVDALPVGTHRIQLVVADAAGRLSDPDTAIVIVTDRIVVPPRDPIPGPIRPIPRPGPVTPTRPIQPLRETGGVQSLPDIKAPDEEETGGAMPVSAPPEKTEKTKKKSKARKGKKK